jgi:hypothetical protein
MGLLCITTSISNGKPNCDAFGPSYSAYFASNPAYTWTKHHGTNYMMILQYLLIKFFQGKTVTGKKEDQLYSTALPIYLDAAKGMWFSEYFSLNGTTAAIGTTTPGSTASTKGITVTGYNTEDNSTSDPLICKADTSYLATGALTHTANSQVPFTYFRRFGNPNGSGKNGTGYAERWLSGTATTYANSPTLNAELAQFNCASSVFFSGIHPFQGEPTAWPNWVFTDPNIRTGPAATGLATHIGSCANGRGTYSTDGNCTDTDPSCVGCTLYETVSNQPSQGSGWALFCCINAYYDASGVAIDKNNPFVKRAMEVHKIFNNGYNKAQYVQNEQGLIHGNSGGMQTDLPLYGLIKDVSGTL